MLGRGRGGARRRLDGGRRSTHPPRPSSVILVIGDGTVDALARRSRSTNTLTFLVVYPFVLVVLCRS